MSDYERDRPGLVREALALIWAARRGLTEDELLRLLRPADLPRLPLAIWSPLRAALDEGLIDRGGIFNFGHEYLRAAVKSAFVQDEAACHVFRLRLAAQFEADPISSRSCDELPWLLRLTEQRKRLQRYLLDVDAFQLILHHSEQELTDYWQWLGKISEAGALYQSAFEHWRTVNPAADLPAQSGMRTRSGGSSIIFAQYSVAEMFYRKALELTERYHGAEAPEMTVILRNLAGQLRETDRLEAAAALLRRAMAIDEHCSPPDDPKLAKDLHSLALLLHRSSHLDQAVMLFQRALAIRQTTSTPGSLEYARTLTALGDVLLDSDKVEDAEAAYRQALQLVEQNGASDSDLAVHSTGCLAAALATKGDIANAESLHLRAIAMCTRVYGPDHPALADELNNLAVLYYENNRVAEAEPLFVRSLNIKESCSGTGHWNVAKACTNLAGVYLRLHRFIEAEQLARKAITQFEMGSNVQRDAAEYAVALNALAIARCKHDDYQTACDLWEQSLRHLLEQSRRNERLHPFLTGVVLNFVEAMIEHGVAAKDGVERLHELFSSAHALDIFPEVMQALPTIKEGEPHTTRELPVAPPVDIALLPTEQRQSIRMMRASMQQQVQFHIASRRAG